MAKKKKQDVVKILVRTDRKFVVTYFAMLLEELEEEKIVTPMQVSQCKEYVRNGLFKNSKS